MWTAGNPADAHLRRTLHAPDNEVPVALPLSVALVHTGDVSLTVGRVEVYSTGLRFTLRGRTRTSVSVLADALVGAPGGRGEGADAFRFGVQFADGTRAIGTPPGSRAPTEGIAILRQCRANGSGRSADSSYWLHPLPPPGPLTFVIRCPELGIPETSVTIDAPALAEAAAGVVELWPWTPATPPDAEPTPAGPPLPADSWFTERPAHADDGPAGIASSPDARSSSARQEEQP